MKTLPTFAAGLLLLAPYPVVGLRAESSVPPPPSAVGAEPKSYALFMGLDVSVERNQQLHRVRDVKGEDFVLEIDGKTVPLTGGAKTSFKLEPSLKLTDASATVTKLNGEQSYTPATDPRRKFFREQPGGAGDAQAALSLGAYNGALNTLAASTQAQNLGSEKADVGAAQAGVGQALHGVDSAYFSAQSDFNSAGYFAGRLQDELNKKLYDAMEVTFTVASEKTLERPYAVLLTTYRDGPKGSLRTIVSGKQLPVITAKPARIRLLQGGFTPGYVLESFQVHLYNRGNEIATDIAPKRVALTRDEAFQFVVMEYLSTHRDATVPPALTLVKAPADLKQRVAVSPGLELCYVRVAPDGMPLAAFSDAACTRKLEDPYLLKVVGDLRFKPALQKGKPIEALTTVNLSQLKS